MLAPAKVNLFLHVGPPGREGYHELCSLMVFADIGDDVRMAANGSGLTITGAFAVELPSGPDNLILRAAAAFARATGARADAVGFELDKALPVASGLGGGSSDAGAALKLLRGALAPDLSDADLEAMALDIGSDGPACLWARSTLARGRGERLSAPPGLPPLPAVLVNAGPSVSTAAVYRTFDAAARFSALDPPRPAPLNSARAAADWLSELRNDLEAPAIEVCSIVGEVLGDLRRRDQTLLARVSGSGGTCFALCADHANARNLAAEVARDNPDWWVAACTLG